MELRIFDKDGAERHPVAPGQPIEFHGSDRLETSFTWDEAARLLRLPAGYVVVKLPDFAKALDCGDRPERVKGDLGHVFSDPSPATLGPREIAPDRWSPGLEALSERVGEPVPKFASLVRECADCGFAYGRLL